VVTTLGSKKLSSTPTDVAPVALAGASAAAATSVAAKAILRPALTLALPGCSMGESVYAAG
jgi:hypothetical protein